MPQIDLFPQLSSIIKEYWAKVIQLIFFLRGPTVETFLLQPKEL
jgi:hypothetical protein